MYQVLDCIDAGSEYCPCFLAESGECLTCSQLQGKTFCDCKNWKGVCIYQEYVWNRFRMKERRENTTCELVGKTVVAKNITILKIKVNKTMARELNQPGAYVFLRRNDEPGYFDTPMSVMTVDEGSTVDIAVQIRVKTKALNQRPLRSVCGARTGTACWDLNILKGFAAAAPCLFQGIAQAPLCR